MSRVAGERVAVTFADGTDKFVFGIMFNELLHAVCITTDVLASIVLVFVDVTDGGVTPRELALSFFVIPEASIDVVEWIVLIGDEFMHQ